jgi:LuxR family transcriptional regulator of csgAB operon
LYFKITCSITDTRVELFFDTNLLRIACLMKKKEPLNTGRHFECTGCPYKDRPIVIVGSNQFSSDILANYIRSNKPARTNVVRSMGEIPPLPMGVTPEEWRLIFVDCQSMNGDAIMKMLQTEGAPYLQHDIIALFNLSPGNADIARFIDLGVRGFFFETDQPDIILKGICALKYGEMWVARGILMEYVSQRPRLAPPTDKAAKLLTRREKDILVQLTTGATNEEIASRLFISFHTVKTHITHIRKKLNVENRLQAALWAAKYLM